MRIYDVFHVDLFMPYKETEAYGMSYTQPPLMIKENENEYEIKSIINSQQHG